MKGLTVSLLLGAVLGCGPAIASTSSTLPAGMFLITADQIERSGAQTAWQVLQRQAPMLSMREDQYGRPASMGRRGRSSFLLDEAPMILLDGVRLGDFRALDSIDAHSILAIFVYNGVEGTTYYGTDAVSGVILIKTKDGRES